MESLKRIAIVLLLAGITGECLADQERVSAEDRTAPSDPSIPQRLERTAPSRAWPSGLGSREVDGAKLPDMLFTVQEADVLRPGLAEITFLIDNYDRDPLGLDVLDGVVACRVGLPSKLELSFSYQITRSVSSPGWTSVPAPPLDIVVVSGAMANGPYRTMYWPMPFLSHSPARVDAMIPGEYTLGIKGRLFSQSGLRPALALALQVTAPGDSSISALSKGSGSGAVNLRFQNIASWRHRRLCASANLGASLNGPVDPADRLIDVSLRHERELPIRRPYFLHGGIGLRYRIWRDVSAVGELSGWVPFGDHTRMQSESGASDALGGLQIGLGNVTLALGVRQHLNPQRNGLRLPVGPLAGSVDLSGLPEETKVALLASLGVEGHRNGANVVVLGWPPDVPLPEAVPRLPDHYFTSTKGNVGFVVRVSIRLGD